MNLAQIVDHHKGDHGVQPFIVLEDALGVSAHLLEPLRGQLLLVLTGGEGFVVAFEQPLDRLDAHVGPVKLDLLVAKDVLRSGLAGISRLYLGGGVDVAGQPDHLGVILDETFGVQLGDALRSAADGRFLDQAGLVCRAGCPGRRLGLEFKAEMFMGRSIFCV